jgi:hypothetical protein
MRSVKGLAIIALLVGGTSLALAQGAPPSPGIVPMPAQSWAASTTAQSGAARTKASRHATGPQEHVHVGKEPQRLKDEYHQVAISNKVPIGWPRIGTFSFGTGTQC